MSSVMKKICCCCRRLRQNRSLDAAEMRQALQATAEQQRGDEGDSRNLVLAEAGQLHVETRAQAPAQICSDASNRERDRATAAAVADDHAGGGVGEEPCFTRVSSAPSTRHESFRTADSSPSVHVPEGVPEATSADCPVENLLNEDAQGHSGFAGPEILQRLSDCLENAQWKQYSDSGGICVSNCPTECKTPGRERLLMMWKVKTVLRRCTQKDVFAIILDTASQTSWNRYVSKVIHHGMDHGAPLLQTCFNSFPISAREALEFRWASADESAETLLVGFSSLGTETLNIPVTPKHERTYTTMSGYCLEKGPEPNTVTFTFVSHVDAAGSVPDWLVRKAGAKGPVDLCKDLQAFINNK